ncbi:uncharacterized protein [Medicago truncatula]|uniref:uncharacterized protein n=1 Tax=Medicago truncatula TaxID=3880 RepID=UPI0019684BA6|nr:uncharacterized protein LOC120578366 [Medicago truncatula]
MVKIHLFLSFYIFKRTLGRDPFINELHKYQHKKKGSGEYVDSRAKTTQEKFDKKAKDVLSPSDGSSPTGTMRLLDHSTSQTIWKEIVGRGKSYKYYGAGSMASNLVHNRCIYERSIDGEGGSRNVEMHLKWLQ